MRASTTRRDKGLVAPLVGAAAVVALTAVQLLRDAGAPAWDTIWAEDGRQYATDALSPSWTRSFFRGYAGYVQIVPRVLALPLRVLPSSWWAFWLAGSAALLAALLAAFVYRASSPFIAFPPLRAAVAMMTAVAPAAYYETNANIANLGWSLLIASFWAIITTRRSRADVGMRIIVLVAAALTTTVAVLFVPLGLGVAWARRSQPRERLVMAAFSAATATQLLADHFARHVVSRPSSSVRDLAQELPLRVMGSAALGERLLPVAWEHLHDVLTFALIGSGIVVLVVLIRVLDRRRVGMLVLTSAFAVVLFVVPVWLRGTSPMRSTSTLTEAGSRYVVVPSALVMAAVACAVDAIRKRWLCIALVVQLALVSTTSLGLPTLRGDGPRWSAERSAVAAACTSGPVAVEIPPRGTWALTTTCARLRRS